MTTPLYALIGFVFWTIAIVVAIGVTRVGQVASGKMAANAFPAGQPHGGDRYWRMNRAHMNCLENLPLFAAVVLTGHVTGLTDGTFATLSQVYIGARIAQTIAHIASNSVTVVNVRFTFFLAQMVCLMGMAWMCVNR